MRKPAREEIASPLPRSEEAEQAVLGAILIDNKAAVEVFGALPAEDFMRPEHQHIYRAMEVCSGDGIDLTTLVDALRSTGNLEAAGGAGYIASLADGIARVSNVGRYVSIVREKAQRRKIIHLAHGLEEAANSAAGTATDIVERGIQEFLGVASDTKGGGKIWEWSDAARLAIQQVHHAAYHPEECSRFMFGLKAKDGLDETLGGLRRKETVLIVGKSGHGKSLLAEELASQSEMDGFHSLIFSAEMSKEAITSREIAYRTQIPFWLVRRPEKLEGRMDLLTKLHTEAGRDRNIGIVEDDITPGRIWAMSEARKRSKGLDLVIVDYDQLVIRSGMRGDEDFFAEQDEFMARAVRMAKRLDICFVLLCQPRKLDKDIDTGKRAPQLSDVFGRAGNAADVVLWVFRDYFMYDQQKEYKDKARVYIVKARNDDTGKVRLRFDTQGPRFLDADTETEPEAESGSRKKKGRA